MKLLIDSDVFCKIAGTTLFSAMLREFGCEDGDALRLPALPRMLRRGRLPKRLGPEFAEELATLADQLPVMPDPPVGLLDALANVADLDAGEAALFALACSSSEYLVLTGDKRAVRAVATVETLHSAINGKIVCFEQLLLTLSVSLGEDCVRAAIAPRAAQDQVIAACFSPGNSSPGTCLRSYLAALHREVDPMCLWGRA